MTLQTVILAAGMGSRLGRALPKPLTELSDGRTIMRQQHDNIRAAFGTGARITTTLINNLQTHDKTFGLETMCVGGGQGMAMIIERLS